MDTMDTMDVERSVGDSLEGLRVLAMFGQIKGDYAQRLLRLLEAAKERWGWEINIFCRAGDRRAFKTAVNPSGRIFTYPNMLQPAPWEADPEHVADVERHLSEAELKALVPVGKIVASCPASIGRAYLGSARHRLSSPMINRILQDNTEPFGIVRRLFGFAEDMLSECKADCVFALEWGTPLHSAVWLSATRRGIPSVALRRSKIHGDLGFWTTDPLMHNTTALADAEARRKSGQRSSAAAKAYIQTFREQPKTSDWVQTKWGKKVTRRGEAVVGWLLLPMRYARALALDVMYRAKGQDTTQLSPAFERVIAPRIRAIVRHRHRRFVRTFDDAALASMKYVYFPIHKETDMPLVYQATPWQDQRNTIQVVAGSLPWGFSLLVREHRSNFGQRPTEYYKHLLRLPNVILIDAYDSQFKYLSNADLIVTENGSSGWEGLLFGRRVVTVAKNFYDGAGLTTKVYDPNHLSAKVVEVLGRPAVSDQAAYDRNLGHLIDAELTTSFSKNEDQLHDALDLLAEMLPAPIKR